MSLRHADTMKQQRIILLVEDDTDLRGMFRTALTVAGFDVREAADGYDALVMLEQGKTDLMVLDLRMPLVSGLDVLEDMRARNENVPVVVVTASPDDLSHLSVECVLKKPVTPEKLIATVTACLAKHT
jgi:DNA-binding response OmpR family regulator